MKRFTNKINEAKSKKIDNSKLEERIEDIMLEFFDKYDPDNDSLYVSISSDVKYTRILAYQTFEDDMDNDFESAKLVSILLSSYKKVQNALEKDGYLTTYGVDFEYDSSALTYRLSISNGNSIMDCFGHYFFNKELFIKYLKEYNLEYVSHTFGVDSNLSIELRGDKMNIPKLKSVINIPTKQRSGSRYNGDNTTILSIQIKDLK